MGSVFVSALKAIAPVLVAILVTASIAKAGGGLGPRFRTVILLYMVSTLAAALVAVIGNSVTDLAVILAVTTVPTYVRMTRAMTLTIRNSDYVRAARMSGAGCRAAGRRRRSRCWTTCSPRSASAAPRRSRTSPSASPGTSAGAPAGPPARPSSTCSRRGGCAWPTSRAPSAGSISRNGCFRRSASRPSSATKTPSPTGT